MTLDDYKQKALDALAVPAGAVDEGLLSAPSTFSSGFNDFLKAHPKAATTGRVGSYFIPGLGEEEAIGNGVVKAVRTASHYMPANVLGRIVGGGVGKIPGLAARAGESFLPALFRAGARGAATGAAVNTAQGLAKDAIGTEDKDQDLVSSAPRVAGLGGLLGMVGHGAQAAAPYIYKHPALINANKLPESNATADEMLDKGMWGSLKGTFSPYADKLKDTINTVRDEIMPSVTRNEQAAADAARPNYPYGNDPRGMTPVSDFRNVGRTEVRNMQKAGAPQSAQDAMDHSFDQAADQLRPDIKGNTSLYDVNQSSKAVNTKIKNGFSQADKGKGFGNLDGTLAAEKQRALALQKGYNDTLESGIDAFGNEGDLDKYNAARGVYRKGADLEDSIKDYSMDTAGGEAHTRHLGNVVADATINSVPVRTGAGVAMSRMDPTTMARAGSQTYGALGHKRTPDGEDFQSFLKKQRGGDQDQSGTVENPFEADYLPNHAAAAPPMAPASQAAPQQKAGRNPFEEDLGQ